MKTKNCFVLYLFIFFILVRPEKSMAVLKAVQGGRGSEKPNSDKDDLKVFIELFEENGNINIAKLEATIEFLGIFFFSST